jgi:hypothetical protein
VERPESMERKSRWWRRQRRRSSSNNDDHGDGKGDCYIIFSLLVRQNLFLMKQMKTGGCYNWIKHPHTILPTLKQADP